MDDKKTVEITIANRTILRVVLVVAASILTILFINRIAHPLTLIFVSFFLAIALNPAVSAIAKRLKSRSRVLATGVAYLIVVALLVGFTWLVIPPMVKQSVDFIKDLPANAEELKYKDTAVVRFINRHNLESQVTSTANDIKSNFDDIGKTTVVTAGRVGSVIVSIIAVFVLTFMMLVEGPIWMKRAWEFQDERKVPKRKRAVARMYKVITGYVNGQLLIAVIAGAFALVALTIASSLLDASINVFVYASIVTLIGLVPMIGNTIAAIIVVLLCAFTSLPLAIIMLIFFIVYQQVENATLQPYIQSKTNELTPMLVFIAALVGIGFGGLLGALVAIPLMGCAKVFITEFYGEKLGLVDFKTVDKR